MASRTITGTTSIDSLSCSSSLFNGTFTYKYTPKSTEYYNRLTIMIRIEGTSISGTYVTVKSINLGNKSASQQIATVKLSDDELATIYKSLPNSRSGTLQFSIHTYSDSAYSKQVGSVSYKEISLTISLNTATMPSVSMTISPQHSLGDTFDGIYVQGISMVKGTITGEGKFNADIASSYMSVEGKKYNNCLSGVLDSSGTFTAIGHVVDTRGISNRVGKKFTVLPYSKPNILPAGGDSSIICARCDAEGNLSESGTYLRIRAKRGYSRVTSGGEQLNFCTLRYRYKSEDSNTFSSWNTLLERTNATTDTVDTILSNVVSSVETSYTVQVGVVDDIGYSDFIQFLIPTDFITIDIPEAHKGKRIGFFCYVEDTNEDGAYFGLPIFGGSVDSLMLGAPITATAASMVTLNNYKTPGCYYSPSADNSKYIINSPYTGGGYGLEVRELQSKNHIRQTMYYGRTTWVRHWDGETWSTWTRHLTTIQEESVCADFVIESGTSEGWTYKKWNGGTYEMYGVFEITPTASDLHSTLYRTNAIQVTTPFKIKNDAVVTGTGIGHYWITDGVQANENAVSVRLMSDQTISLTGTVTVRLHAVGTYV